VKACPYCARSIEDDAVRCPYCQGDLTAHSPSSDSPSSPAPPSTAAATPPGTGALRFTHSGFRFVLGYGTDFFGIWERDRSGGPMERFPRTDPGWIQAWNRFHALEPQAVEVPSSTTARPSPGRPQPVTGQPEPSPSAGAQPTIAPTQQQPEGAGEAPARQRIGEGALRFSHSGSRYILGYGVDFFGIWDRQTPGEPVLRFPRTDEGWSQAWNRFTAWEPRAMEVAKEGTPAPDPRGAPVGIYRSGHTLAGVIVAAISLTVILELVAAALWAAHVGTVSSFARGTATYAQLRDSRDAALGADGFTVALVAITAVVWLIWQFRAHTNLRALGAAQLKYTPGWAVAWWFIPIANIVMPYLTMRELYKASDPAAGSVDWATRGGAGLLGMWWAARLITQVLFQIGTAIDIRSVPALRAEAWFFLLANMSFAGLSVLAILVVRAVDSRQSQKRERMSAWMRSFGQPG